MVEDRVYIYLVKSEDERMAGKCSEELLDLIMKLKTGE